MATLCLDRSCAGMCNDHARRPEDESGDFSLLAEVAAGEWRAALLHHRVGPQVACSRATKQMAAAKTRLGMY